MNAAASPGRAALAQTSVELRLTARRGENLLAVAIIPVVVLVFFSTTGVVETPGMSAVEFLLPGSLALAVVAAGLVSLGIATAYERQYGVLKRLGGSPLGRSGLVVAKVASVAVIVIVQTVLLVAVAAAFLGWSPGPAASVAALVLALALGTAAFAGLGLLLAGTLRAEATLALANGLFIAILLLGGIVVPLDRLPEPLAAVAGVLPGAALSDALRMALGSATAASGPWFVLAVWAVVAIGLTLRSFRWD